MAWAAPAHRLKQRLPEHPGWLAPDPEPGLQLHSPAGSRLAEMGGLHWQPSQRRRSRLRLPRTRWRRRRRGRACVRPVKALEPVQGLLRRWLRPGGGMPAAERAHVRWRLPGRPQRRRQLPHPRRRQPRRRRGRVIQRAESTSARTARPGRGRKCWWGTRWWRRARRPAVAALATRPEAPLPHPPATAATRH